MMKSSSYQSFVSGTAAKWAIDCSSNHPDRKDECAAVYRGHFLSQTHNCARAPWDRAFVQHLKGRSQFCSRICALLDFQWMKFTIAVPPANMRFDLILADSLLLPNDREAELIMMDCVHTRLLHVIHLISFHTTSSRITFSICR